MRKIPFKIEDGNKELFFNVLGSLCTGKTDRQGELLYEGDIIKFFERNEFGSAIQHVGKIVWDDLEPRLIVKTMDDSDPRKWAISGNCEKIGDINKLKI